MSPSENRAQVIRDMMEKDTKLIPAPMGGLLCKMPVLQWFKNGNNNKQYPFHKYCFGNCVGSIDDMAVYIFAMETTKRCGTLKAANTTWDILCCISKEKPDLTGSDVLAYFNRDVRFQTGQYQQGSSIYSPSCTTGNTSSGGRYSNEVAPASPKFAG
eukprot:9365898-Ditylum_brightwellii.AAC.1